MYMVIQITTEVFEEVIKLRKFKSLEIENKRVTTSSKEVGNESFFRYNFL